MSDVAASPVCLVVYFRRIPGLIVSNSDSNILVVVRHYRNISIPTLSLTQSLAVHACSMAIHCAVWSAAFEGL